LNFLFYCIKYGHLDNCDQILGTKRCLIKQLDITLKFFLESYGTTNKSWFCDMILRIFLKCHFGPNHVLFGHLTTNVKQLGMESCQIWKTFVHIITSYKMKAQVIALFFFQKRNWIETSFIFHKTKNMHHGNLGQL
jgi:hypothetical protein